MESMFDGTAPAVEVLGAHPLFHSEDLDEARQRVSEVFCPHNLSVAGAGERLDVRMYHRRVRGISLNRLNYGASMVVEPDRLSSFLLVQMPLRGGEIVRCGNEHVDTDAHVASVVSPTLPVQMRPLSNTEKFLVQIDRETLERYCSQHLGTELRQPIEFKVSFPLNDRAASGWCQLMAFLCAELSRDDSVFQSPLFASQIEQLVVNTLLLSQYSNYYQELKAPAPSLAPYSVKRVEEYIRSHADQPLTIVDLAAHAGVSSRALFAAFRRFRNTSPMAFLKSVRLERAHADLLAATPGSETVTRVATRWGFGHLGHFTTDYRRQFGETPSQTLARR